MIMKCDLKFNSVIMHLLFTTYYLQSILQKKVDYPKICSGNVPPEERQYSTAWLRTTIRHGHKSKELETDTQLISFGGVGCRGWNPETLVCWETILSLSCISSPIEVGFFKKKITSYSMGKRGEKGLLPFQVPLLERQDFIY